MEWYHDGFSQEHAKTFSDDGTSPKEYGYYRYEPRVVNQMLESAFQFATTILDDAKISERVTVDAYDLQLAIQCCANQSFTSPFPRDFFIRL